MKLYKFIHKEKEIFVIAKSEELAKNRAKLPTYLVCSGVYQLNADWG